MKGGSLDKMPEDYVEVQDVEPTEFYTGDNVWDILDELSETDVKVRDPLLTLGCCIGKECAQFRKVLKGRIVGVDVVPGFVAKARKMAQEQRLWLEFHVADIHELPFKDREFDTVYSRGTLEHCYNLEKAVAEIQRVAGRLIVITADLVPDDHPLHFVGGADYAFSDDPEEWKKLFDVPGWELRHEWMVEGRREYQVLHMAWERSDEA